MLTPADVPALIAAISAPRLSSYRKFFQPQTDQELLGVYLWHEDVCAALNRNLKWVEVTMRNRFHRALSQRYGTGAAGPSRDWYHHLGLSAHSRDSVRKVTHSATGQLRRPAPAPDDVVAKQTLGFWPALLDVSQDVRGARLAWGDILIEVVPGHRQDTAAYWRAQAHRDALFARLDLCRYLRNRIAHHEPIWKQGALYEESRPRQRRPVALVAPAPRTPEEAVQRLKLQHDRVMELLHWLWERERNGVPLHVGNAAKGNRHLRYPEEVYETVEEVAEELFLRTQSKWTLRTLTEAINLRLHDMKLLPRSQNVSRDFVKRTVLGEVDADPSHVRMNPHDAIAAKAVAGKRYRIASLFERVEQDALHLPWVIRTPYGDSDKVYLVHAIDCAASMPLGWCLTIGAPRTPDTLRCVESILFPKKRRFEALGLKYDFDVYGTPNMVVVDNGPENKGERVMRLARLSITVNRLKARHAHRKPFIERLNKSLKEYLETLPGCTRFDGKDGERDPVALGDPVMTLEEMERWIVRFYFEEWVNNPLERLAECVFVDNENLGNTPLKRYRVLTEEKGCPIPLPPSVDAWRSTIYDQLFRKLSLKTGISYANYHFKGGRLSYVIEQFGEADVKVLIDKDDFRWVYVVAKDGRTLVPLINDSTSERTPAYSYDEAAAVLQEAADEGVDITRENLRRDVLNRSIERAPKDRKARGGSTASGRKAEKSKDTTTKARRHAAVQRSAEKPLPPSPPGLGHPPLGSSEDDWANVDGLTVFDRKTGEIRR